MNKGLSATSFKLLFLVLTLVVMTSCGGDDDTSSLSGDWKQIANFAGESRLGAVAVVVNGKAYVGLGFSADDGYLRDFKSYDPELNTWIEIDSFPVAAGGRSRAAGFALNNKLYVGTGWDGQNEKKDFWEYDPATDTWAAIADFPGVARNGAVAFESSGKGYVGTGVSGDKAQQDFYSYDGTEWKKVLNFPGEGKAYGFVFTVDGIPYVGSGESNDRIVTDFFSFNASIPALWERKESLLSAVGREQGVAFTIGSKGYVSTGINQTNLSSTYEYDPSTDTWSAKSEFEGASRRGAVAFTIGNRAFVGLGTNGSRGYNDFWEFLPNEESNR